MRSERSSTGSAISTGRRMATGSAGAPGRARNAPSTASHHTTASQAVNGSAIASHTLARVPASNPVCWMPSQSPVSMVA